MDNNKNLSKCLKSYLTAKKYYDSDINKSLQYFKQCIKFVDSIKKNPGLQLDILDETESECIKYITLTSLQLLDKPLITNSQNKENLFEIIETGNINFLKRLNYGDINLKEYNNEGLTVLHYAIKFGDTRFIKDILILGSHIDETNIHGHSLLEYACLENDPNMINFLILYGADMKKHLLFREGKRYFNKGSEIDILLLEKYIIDNFYIQNYQSKYLTWIYEYLNPNESLAIEYSDNYYKVAKLKNKIIYIKNLIDYLDNYLSKLNLVSRTSYIEILKEELKYDLINNLGCPKNKLDIVLYNLIPFIDYNIELKLNWLLSLEIKFIIFKILKETFNINNIELKSQLKDIIYKSYIETNLVSEGQIQVLIYQWISKIKV